MRSFKGLKPERGKPRYRTSLAATSIPDQVNVVFVYGAGNDERYGGGLRYLQDECVNKYEERIYSPRIIDHRELSTLIAALEAWGDPTILVAHSCGGETVTEASVSVSSEVIPYVMVIAPSIHCRPVPVSGNVARIAQATSEPGDVYNPDAEVLISLAPGNNVTRLEEFRTNMSHLEAPYSDLCRDHLFNAIDSALAGGDGGDEEQPPEPEEPSPPKGRPVVTVTVEYPSAEVEVVVQQNETLG